MLAACARLILSGREDREHSNTVAAGLGGACCGCNVEPALDDGEGLAACSAQPMPTSAGLEMILSQTFRWFALHIQRPRQASDNWPSQRPNRQREFCPSGLHG